MAMQISSLFSRQSDPAVAGQRPQPVELLSDGGSGGTASSGSTSGVATGDAVRRIVGAYDVTNITPRTFSEMLQKIHQTGALPDKEYQELAGIRADLESAGIGSDERIDLTEFCADRLRETQEEMQSLRKSKGVVSGAGEIEGVMQRRLDWILKCGTIRESEGTPHINALI
jgi:hypothetical protein